MQEGNPDDLVRLHNMLEAAFEVAEHSAIDGQTSELVQDECHDYFVL